MTVIWEPRHARHAPARSAPLARQIRDQVERFAFAGVGNVKRLRGEGGVCRLRSGDWRIRYIRRGDDLHVLAVKHRSEAYR
jgi:mRNA-degrading endonuclease RelE of RelBE toxin-antitoxin system